MGKLEELQKLYDDNIKLEAVLVRIRALHKPYAHPDLKMTVCDFDGYPYPCRELRILDETDA
jgi:citrate lyase beta subunit